MYDLPSNSIKLYASNPLFGEIDFSDVHLSDVTEQIKKFKNQSKSKSYPETDALKFYFGNHVFHVVKSNFNSLQKLSKDEDELVVKHIENASDISKRLFYYGLMICVEEARFLPHQDDSFHQIIKDSYGDEFHDWMSGGFKGSLDEFGNLDMTVGQLSRAMVSVFGFGSWNPGFGGKGWVPIASLISECAHGKISFESFSDQAFSLCHNNGSMFNKGHLYHCYSKFIYNILDIQDSGQIPQWIDSNKSNKFIDKDLSEIFKLSKKLFPDQVSGKVDQSLVGNSESKRLAKEKALQSHNSHHWNHASNQKPVVKEKPDTRKNNILLGGF